MKRLIQVAAVLVGVTAMSAGALAGATCAGDINGDGRVDDVDLEIFKAAFNTAEGEAGWDARADLDGDGFVGGSDYGVLMRSLKGGC